MANLDWHKCKFLESSENLKPLVRRRFGREPSSSIAREIAACLQQGRLFYEAAASSPLEIRPLQQFYGMVGFARAIVVANGLRSLSTFRPAHGLKDISQGNSRIADLRLRIDRAGTFQQFNDVMAPLTRLCYIDRATRRRFISVPSAPSVQLRGVDLSLRDILCRVPGLESLYRMTFNEESLTAPLSLDVAYRDDAEFRIRVDDPMPFDDRESLRRIVTRWRTRFPFLQAWRLSSAQYAYGYSVIYFRNRRNADVDEFSETYLGFQNDTFQESPISDDVNEIFTLADGFSPTAGGYTGTIYATSPIRDLYISEFSVQYLGLFLLSSLMRYRPQIWTHAIARSVGPEGPADDRGLSLIERFLDLNGNVIPQMVVTILNPDEDEYFA